MAKKNKYSKYKFKIGDWVNFKCFMYGDTGTAKVIARERGTRIDGKLGESNWYELDRKDQFDSPTAFEESELTLNNSELIKDLMGVKKSR